MPSTAARARWVLALLATGTALSALDLAAQRVEGRTLDPQGRPVAAVSVHLVDAEGGEDLLGVVSDSTGWFVLPLPRSGTVRLRAEALGYASSLTEVLEVARDEAVVVELRMSVEAIALAPLLVTARRADVHRAHRDFYRRTQQIEQTGFGVVLDKETLEKTWDLSHRLVEVPALDWHYGPDGEMRLGSVRCRGGVFLNGMYVGNPAIDELVFPTDLEGIELYRRESEIPPELAGGAGQPLCTVAALWTRVGTTVSSDRSYWMRMGLFGALIGGFVLYVSTN